MSDELRPYPEYKDSGLPWLGWVPKHWKIKRAKNLFRCVDIRSKTGTEERLTVSAEYGVVPRSTMKVTMFEAQSYIGHKLCWPGDLVINSLWAWSRGLGVARHHGLISSAYGVYRLSPNLVAYSDFIHHLVRSQAYHWELRTRSKGVWTSRLQLTDDAFLRAPILLPPEDEAKTIARFIRGMDRRVNAFIRNRRRLIEVLNEQKQAIIDHAVTRGLDPNVPLKPSGIDWLGDIPEHWAIVPLRWYMRTGSGDFLDGQNIAAERSTAHPHPVIGGNGVLGYTSLVNCSEPTIVIGRVGALCGNVHLVESAAWITDNALRVSRIRCFSLDYLSLLLRTMNLNRLANANAQPLITGEMIKSQIGILPSEKDQNFIVKYVANATKDLIEAIIKAQREIDLIREYRTRLISDVVTGKVDVRHLAPPPGSEYLEEMVEELEPLDDAAGELEDEALAGEVSRAD